MACHPGFRFELGYRTRNVYRSTHRTRGMQIDIQVAVRSAGTVHNGECADLDAEILPNLSDLRTTTEDPDDPSARLR